MNNKILVKDLINEVKVAIEPWDHITIIKISLKMMEKVSLHAHTIAALPYSSSNIRQQLHYNFHC